MDELSRSNFRPIDRETGFLLPPSVDEWLPKTHLARFVVEVIDGLDLSAMTKSYRGSGSASYQPVDEVLNWPSTHNMSRPKLRMTTLCRGLIAEQRLRQRAVILTASHTGWVWRRGSGGSRDIAQGGGPGLS